MDEPSATQTVRHIAARGDRARRVSAADGRVARLALPVAASACLASAAALMLGWPPALGLVLLVGAGIAAGVSTLSARRARPMSDDAVTELDRAAALGGSLRSAHWFAVSTPATRDTVAPPWIAFHLDAAAGRAARVDWSRVYERTSARLTWSLALVCAVATLGLSTRPVQRRPTLPRPTPDAARAAAPGAPPPGVALVPEVVDGMRAMQSGRAPSQEQLTAIGRVLEVAKTSASAQRQIERQLAESTSPRVERPLSAPDRDSDSESWPDDANNGFELADLDWAYQDAMARPGADERSRPDSGADSTASGGRQEGQPGDQGLGPAASGSLPDVPIEGDARGRAASFSSLLAGRQQAGGDAGPPAPPQSPSRTAALSAALRSEVVHARTDVDVPNPAIPSASRRGTNAGPPPIGAVRSEQAIRYDRSRAPQPPAVPDARRALVHDLFLRSADAGPPVKRP